MKPPAARSVIPAILKQPDAPTILALCALVGLYNAAGFLRFGQTLSHVTGNLTKAALAMGGQSAHLLPLLLACLISFFAGAATVGAFFGQLATRRRTGFVLLLGGALIAVTDALFGLDFLLIPALGLAMGAQNALGLRFFGAINRTTHMTGHITDCACAIGRMLGKQGSKRDDVIQLVFHGACLLVFALGAWLAAVVRAPLWLNAQPGMLLGLYLLQFQPNRHFWRKLSAPRQSEPEQ